MTNLIVKRDNDMEHLGPDEYCGNHSYFNYEWTELSTGEKHGIFKTIMDNPTELYESEMKTLYINDVKIWSLDHEIFTDRCPKDGTVISKNTEWVEEVLNRYTYTDYKTNIVSKYEDKIFKNIAPPKPYDMVGFVPFDPDNCVDLIEEKMIM